MGILGPAELELGLRPGLLHTSTTRVCCHVFCCCCAFRRSVVRTAPRVVRAQQTRLPIASARAYSTGGASSGGASWVQLALAAGVGAGVGVGLNLLGGDASSLGREASTAAKGAAQSAKVAANFVPKKEDYQKVTTGLPRSSMPTMMTVRTALYSSVLHGTRPGPMTRTPRRNYATMRFEPEALHGANNGLNIARAKMEEVKKEFPWISYGDLWTLGGVAALQEMDGPKIPWRPGRIDGYAKDATPDGRLPDATQGADHLRNIFYRMGFNDQEIVALSGAHALGRCHRDRSGFDGPWTFSPTTLTNEYYKLLLNEKWQWRKWDGPKQLEDKTTKSLMMLPTDMVLVQDKKFKPWVQKYAESQDAFFKDFSDAVVRLFEVGVPPSQFGETILFKKLEEQS
ncbi:manganese peroxidase 2 [Rhizoctonia solani]|uniref:Peroxidase n=1 Tax=Rhizoctonia solani TaxID=456999 RepID=A0A8H8P0K1_9AGAM|nr:manganese peroxidase 2 [Rhizoctonia solani]QRW21668.1 manganese peroxidase 2 [Rhizoctonia solani]